MKWISNVKLLFLVIVYSNAFSDGNINIHVLSDNSDSNNQFEKCDDWTTELSIEQSNEMTYLTNSHGGISCSRTIKNFDVYEGASLEFLFQGEMKYGDVVLIEILNGNGFNIWNEYLRESITEWKPYKFTINQRIDSAKVS